MITIELENGNILTNLERNVDVFISEIPISKDVFEGGLSVVKIFEDGELLETKTNQELVGLYEDDGKYIFGFSTILKEDLRYAQTRSDIEYIAMMADVNLGTEETL